MTILIQALFVAYAAGVLIQGWYLVRTLQLVRRRDGAAPADAAESAQLPRMDVVIPVKDEAGHIERCIRSVLAQDYPTPLRIIVVNDRSSDGTADVVARVQAEHANVQREDIALLPAGCFGKPHAIHQIAGRLGGEAIAFVDSDLYLEPNCLRSLAGRMQAERLDWLALMGRPAVERFWERLLIPLLGAATFAWYDPRKVNDPAWDDAVGSALMVCRKSAYDAIGGHGAVISTYDEDSELVRIAKRAGQRVAFELTPELFSQRHYQTLRRTIHGLTRTLIGAIKTVPRMLLTINAFNFVSLLPIGIVLVLLLARVFGAAVPWMKAWAIVAGAHLIVSFLMAAAVYRTAGTEWRYALLHPLGSAMMIGVCLRAVGRMLRGGEQRIAWRGTQY